MKRFLAALLAAICVFSFSGCGTSFASKEIIGDSEIYSKREIKNAISLVYRQFVFFEGCVMLEIEYDEEYSKARADGWAEQYDADEAIILFSKFYVAGENPSLERGETYTKWNWILVRNHGGFWKLKTWGYG